MNLYIHKSFDSQTSPCLQRIILDDLQSYRIKFSFGYLPGPGALSEKKKLCVKIIESSGVLIRLLPKKKCFVSYEL